jgi:arylsulfatase A-like enzyme
MKKALLFPVLSLLLLSSCTSGRRTKENSMITPNVLFIAVDDLRPELNCFGASHIQSPHIDQLAAEGMIFTEAHCNIPVCGASRASVLTGARPTRFRYLDYRTRAEDENPGVLSLPKHFKNNGYFTISNGKIFHHRNDLADSWNEIWAPSPSLAPGDFLTPDNAALANREGLRGPTYESADVQDSAYRDGKIALKTIRDLRRLKDMDQPFFLACGFMKPHLPFNAPSRYWNLYDRSSIKLPENMTAAENAPAVAQHNSEELRKYWDIPREGPVSDSLARTLIHGYYACVSYVDQMIGMVLNELKALDLEKNTIVILWGDHGYNLMEHGLWNKHSNYRTSLRSVLMLKVPGKTHGAASDAMVEFVDIYPTLCDLADLDLPGHLEGESLVPLVYDPNGEWKKYVISKWFDGLTIKTGDYAYTEWSKSDTAVYARMLFDHQNDKAENINISENQEAKAIIDELSLIMKENRGKDFNSPLPGGKVIEHIMY